MSTVPIIDDVDLARRERFGVKNQMLVASVRIHVDERTTVVVEVDSPPLDGVSNEQTYMRIAHEAEGYAKDIAKALSEDAP